MHPMIAAAVIGFAVSSAVAEFSDEALRDE
jgi:hypothetical protein